MALFGMTSPRFSRSRDQRSLQALRGAVVDGTISIIGPGMVVVGDIATDGVVRVEGEVKGTVRARAVILGATGRVHGDILTDEAVIGGSVLGAIVANSRVELQNSSVVEGEIHARPQHFKLDEGARFIGEVKMLPDAPASSTSDDRTGFRSPGADTFGREVTPRAYQDEEIDAQVA